MNKDNLINEKEDEFLEDFPGDTKSIRKIGTVPGDRKKRGGYGGLGGGNQRKGKSTEPKEKPGKPGQGMSGGGEEGRGQVGGQGEREVSRSANANRRKKKKGTGKQGIGPKKAAGAKGKKPDAPKAGDEKQQDGETEAGEAGQSEKEGKAQEKIADTLKELGKFVPIPAQKSDGTLEDLVRATGVSELSDIEETQITDFEISKWMLIYKFGEGKFLYTSYQLYKKDPKDGNALIINNIFKEIVPASKKILNSPKFVFQYIVYLKQLLRASFEDKIGRKIIKRMNKELEKISKNILSYYLLIKDDPKDQFDKDLVSSANKVKLKAQTDAAYASNIPAEIFKSIVGSGRRKSAIVTTPTRQQESKTMNQDDIKKLIKEAFTDKVYGKYPYSHQTGEEGEPAEDYAEDWKRFCLEMVQDTSKQKAIEIAKLLIKDIELFEDVLDLAGQNQSVGSEILRKMQKD